MKSIFRNLTLEEQENLLKIPVLVSLYVSSSDQEISKKERAEAIKFAHLKFISAPSSLTAFYQEVDLSFQAIFEREFEIYYPFDVQKRSQLSQDIKYNLNIAKKLDEPLEKALVKSIAEYRNNVQKAIRGDLLNLVIPFPLPGLTD